VILRAIDTPKLQSSPNPAGQMLGAEARPIWEAIEASQKALVNAAGERGVSAGSREQSARAKSLATESSNQEVWLIPQPAHSALSGEIAAKLDPQAFGEFDEATIRAIALHDAGWSGPDVDLIRESRSHPIAQERKTGDKGGARKAGWSGPDAELIRESRSQPIGEQRKAGPFDFAQGRLQGGARKSEASRSKVVVSFVGAPPDVAVKAWTDSVETALNVSGVGAFLVSEHFKTIAQFQAKAKPETAKHMTRFMAQEETRQAKLRPKLRLSDTELQRMVDGLRFCDLLSLYICAGITETVEFPHKIQADSILAGRLDEQTIKLSPSPFLREEMFGFAALRHPRTKLVSSASFAVRITA
jgi:hypothetical protein